MKEMFEKVGGGQITEGHEVQQKDKLKVSKYCDLCTV